LAETNFLWRKRLVVPALLAELLAVQLFALPPELPFLFSSIWLSGFETKPTVQNIRPRYHNATAQKE
jgi:hypothetical protein